MLKILTLDCETTVGYPKGDPRWEHPERMPLAVVGMDVHFDGNPYLCWWGPDVPMLNMCADHRSANQPMMQKYLDQADVVITFNGEHFDLMVLEGAGFDMTHAKSVSYDLMTRFIAVTGHRISLADLARALAVQEKIGSGENAALLWQAANELLQDADRMYDCGHDSPHRLRAPAMIAGAKHLYQSVISYCLLDVKITRACYDTLVDFNGRVRYWQKFKRGYRGVQLALP